MSAELAVRGALVALWRGDDALSELVGGRVYDAVPAAEIFPHVELGPSQEVPFDDGENGRVKVFLDVHVWDRDEGRTTQALKVMTTLRRTLTAGNRARALVDPEGAHVLDAVRWSDSRTFRDQDGLTAHGVLAVEAVVTPIGG